ncbi:MAG: hypothetical protein V4850_14165 [Myxococcota bacterium]
MADHRREIDRSPWDWILYERDADGAFVLEVVVGWIGVFTVEEVLSADQVATWRQEGRDGLSRISAVVNTREIAAARGRMRRG